MELYLDSVDLREIEEAFQLGFLTGLTTTPTFMHREGVKDVDAMILKLAGMVPILQVEALGEKADKIVAEAMRQVDMGLNPDTTVFKIPVSLEGVKACRILRNRGLMVNVHLIYTLQQAYMAMAAGATYVCPLVGRLQDQGHDALDLVAQAVNAVHMYGYDTKIMFSSVRNAEHVRNAINLGAHTITVPWKIMKQLTNNNFTTVGTREFTEHTRLMTNRVEEVIRKVNPTINEEGTVLDAIVQMTEGGFGAVAVVNGEGHLAGVFTDGDLRRLLRERGNEVLGIAIGKVCYTSPLTIQGTELLITASEILKSNKVDNIIVLHEKRPIGMLDIQDLARLNEI